MQHAKTFAALRFRSIRAKLTDDEIIMDMLRKPRTTNEIAERLGKDLISMGNILAFMAERGRIKKAERINGVQIWEAVK